MQYWIHAKAYGYKVRSTKKNWKNFEEKYFLLKGFVSVGRGILLGASAALEVTVALSLLGVAASTTTGVGIHAHHYFTDDQIDEGQVKMHMNSEWNTNVGSLNALYKKVIEINIDSILYIL